MLIIFLALPVIGFLRQILFFYRKMLELLPDKNFLEKQFLQLPISQEVIAH